MQLWYLGSLGHDCNDGTTGRSWGFETLHALRLVALCIYVLAVIMIQQRLGIQVICNLTWRSRLYEIIHGD